MKIEYINDVSMDFINYIGSSAKSLINRWQEEPQPIKNIIHPPLQTILRDIKNVYKEGEVLISYEDYPFGTATISIKDLNILLQSENKYLEIHAAMTSQVNGAIWLSDVYYSKCNKLVIGSISNTVKLFMDLYQSDTQKAERMVFDSDSTYRFLQEFPDEYSNIIIVPSSLHTSCYGVLKCSQI